MEATTQGSGFGVLTMESRDFRAFEAIQRLA